MASRAATTRPVKGDCTGATARSTSTLAVAVTSYKLIFAKPHQAHHAPARHAADKMPAAGRPKLSARSDRRVRENAVDTTDFTPCRSLQPANTNECATLDFVAHSRVVGLYVGSA